MEDLILTRWKMHCLNIIWHNQSFLSCQCSATELWQPDNHQPSYMYCTGGTECLSHTHCEVSGCMVVVAQQLEHWQLKSGVLGQQVPALFTFLYFCLKSLYFQCEAKSSKQNKLQRCSRVIRPVPAAGQNPDHLVFVNFTLLYLHGSVLWSWSPSIGSFRVLTLKLYCEMGQMLLARHCDWLCSI